MIKTSTSNERKLATLQANHCKMCGENRVPALMNMEAHHVIGNQEGRTITICQNCHKVFEQKKEGWNRSILEKSRKPYFKLLAYVMFACDYVAMHGEQLLNYYNLIEEHNPNEVIEFNERPEKANWILYVIGSLMVNVSNLVKNKTNNAATDNETEKKVMKFWNEFVEEIMRISEDDEERGEQV